MQSVRCDECGLRALVAASQCPHCGHLFELRDSRGELLPLSLCSTCDSYYPRKQGECQWCGPSPERFRIPAAAWKGAGVLAFAGLAWAAWLAHRTAPGGDVLPPTSAREAQDSPASYADAGLVTGALALADSAGSPPERTAMSTTSSDSLSGDVVDPPTPMGPPAPVVPPAAMGPPAPGTPPAATRPVAAADTPPVRTAASPAPVSPVPRAVRASPKASAASRRRGRWVAAVARSWVPVRVAADQKSRILASIGPDTRVQLGEAQGAWVRLRMRGISGWVERRHFPARSTSRR